MCYHYLFVNQGILSMLVNGSAMHIMLHSGYNDKINETPVIIGATVWVIGFICEFFGDLQLLDHKDNPAMKGKLLKTGLWRYSRHPNYFGEIMCWWGIYFMACSGKSLEAGGHKTIYAPLLITFLMIFVSGVRMMETKKMMDSVEFRIYM